MAKNLMEKSMKIQLPDAKPAATEVTPSAPPKAKTAPGTLMGFMEGQSATHQENKLLREQLREADRVALTFKGASPVKMLDPAKIRRSDWANRNTASFEGTVWAEFKADILGNGGNETPIRVRPLSEPVDGIEFEIIYGHRRHRACLELGIPVRAQIEDATEHMLFVAMELENRSRKDLSPWEQGMFYAKALDKGLYPSARKLADAIRRDSSDVGKALALARLPEAVVSAFASPLEIQYRWAKPLNDAHQADPDGLISRAKAIAAYGRRQSAGAVLAQLIAPQATAGQRTSEKVDIEIGKVGNKATAVLTSDKKGRAVLKFQVDLPAKKRQALAAYAEKLLFED